MHYHCAVRADVSPWGAGVSPRGLSRVGAGRRPRDYSMTLVLSLISCDWLPSGYPAIMPNVILSWFDVLGSGRS